MWLAIDAGNSHVVIGIFGEPFGSTLSSGPRNRGQAPRPLRTYRLTTHPIGTADELRARLQALLAPENLRLDELKDVVLASVVPAFTRVARDAFGGAYGNPGDVFAGKPQNLRVIDSTWPFSFRIATENPAQTGIDRLVNAEAAVREGFVPAILVDSGTTTTICAIAPARAQDRTGAGERPAFLGGAILPGLEACRDALPARAAQLFPVDLVPPPHAIGRGTESAIRSGVVLGYASMIEGMIARFKAELAAASLGAAPEPRVIVTGGVSRLLTELCPSLQPARGGALDPDLTLKGIAYLYESAASR